MASSPNHAVRDDGLDARCARIRQRLLDGIEQTLDELAQPDFRPSLQGVTVACADQTPIAHLFCRHALCRRAGRCRTKPCKAFATDRATER